MPVRTFDEAGVTFDEAGVYYDGVSPVAHVHGAFHVVAVRRHKVVDAMPRHIVFAGIRHRVTVVT